MGTLKQWEQTLERWQDALVAKFFHSEPVELLDRLRGECDDHVVVCSQTRVMAPNAYEVEIDSGLHNELAGHARPAPMRSLRRASRRPARSNASGARPRRGALPGSASRL